MRIEHPYSLYELNEENITLEKAEEIANLFFEELLDDLYPEESLTINESKIIHLIKDNGNLYIEIKDGLLSDYDLTPLYEHFSEVENEEVSLLRGQYDMNVFKKDIWRPGSASGKDADINIPKTPDTNKPNYRWNHDIINSPEALKIMRSTTDPERNKLDGQTGIRLFQLDSGYSKHESFTNSENYKDLEKGFIESTGFIGNESDAKNEAIDSLNEYKIGFGNRQKPSHATATGFTIIGDSGIGPESYPEIKDIPKIDDFPVFFTKNYSGGLFPYVDFFPVKAAKYVGFADGFRGWLTRRVLGIKTNKPFSLIKALEHVRTHNADVVTMSIGGAIHRNERALHDECKANYANGIIQVCAAGNSRSLNRIEREIRPAEFLETICCAAVEPKNGNEIIPWSKSCDGIYTDISAPGRYIYTATQLAIEKIPDEYKDSFSSTSVYKWGGATSQATAHVAAAASMWRHYFGPLLEDEFYSLEGNKWRIVEAFRFALYSSRTHHELGLNYKGLLNMEKMLSDNSAPDSIQCQEYIKLVEQNKHKARFIIYQQNFES